MPNSGYLLFPPTPSFQVPPTQDNNTSRKLTDANNSALSPPLSAFFKDSPSSQSLRLPPESPDAVLTTCGRSRGGKTEGSESSSRPNERLKQSFRGKSLSSAVLLPFPCSPLSFPSSALFSICQEGGRRRGRNTPFLTENEQIMGPLDQGLRGCYVEW